jgi:hypothetical protein
VFASFANHFKPPCGAAAAREALGDAKWLDDARFYPIILVGGAVPVEFGGDGTVYCLYLFPFEDGWSDWVIYLRLSGGHRTADDLRAFLRGGKGLQRQPELVAFALCYPERSEGLAGPVEHFGPKGMTVLDWD